MTSHQALQGVNFATLPICDKMKIKTRNLTGIQTRDIPQVIRVTPQVAHIKHTLSRANSEPCKKLIFKKCNTHYRP